VEVRVQEGQGGAADFGLLMGSGVIGVECRRHCSFSGALSYGGHAHGWRRLTIIVVA
jgi:hypothetical protein